ncbi:molybdenum cofactor guanylyltransferase [Aurantiacibacter luteus]|uniref:Molybdenum cofactor guanylyltransferase n=1 Tax=Aurantiacibacter luteus TaxID=1581420 RepID=A0A0G9MV34_9SPHN|nr:molybdenum cofactor guanylyltransferase [Aurantiacibacter luteus]KLE34575.1 molybdenum cofactor guanylyltransferase [Aurantiacibacter luteus]
MILGAVLAGGQSSRFGSDKALAELGGETLLERAVASLSRWCDRVVVVGREQAPAPTLPDWPAPGMGPLGGIAAALRHAEAEGFASVLTCGVDSARLPQDLPDLLSPAPAFLESQPVIGHWKNDAASCVSAILQSEGRHSMLAFARAARARAVKASTAPANINTPADLAELEQTHGI